MSDAIEDLLKRTMGLDAVTIGSNAITRAIAIRMTATHLTDRAAYQETLATPNSAELRELIEEIVVPETWFFRDGEAFVALARLALATLAVTNADACLNILSVPCSTGEEPYSIAMALLDAGVPPDRFTIDALDISTRALARAQRGLYGKNSFRGRELGFRERYFVATDAGWQVSAGVRRQVRFHHGNLLGDESLPGATTCDVIFCRNLLIYFDRETQNRALARLASRLAPKGFFFVGPSETRLLADHGFASVKIPLSFAFRRPEAPPREAPAVVSVSPRRKVPVVPPTPASKRRTNPPFARVITAPKPTASASAPAAVASDPAAELEALRALADQGALAEAIKRGEQFLRTHGPSAAVCYLLGVVQDASGQPAAAAESYRRAIYLDPSHQEALVHLALLREREGDHSAAKALNDRARRLLKQVGA